MVEGDNGRQKRAWKESFTALLVSDADGGQEAKKLGTSSLVGRGRGRGRGEGVVRAWEQIDQAFINGRSSARETCLIASPHRCARNSASSSQ